MYGKQLTEEFANQVWDILVKHVGALEADRDMFVYAHTNLVNPCFEWRFGGKFGFGGKYWSERNAITYYSEDRTKKLDTLEKKVNKLLGELNE
jgi:hypothetical protein